jgi:hypothetical protein
MGGGLAARRCSRVEGGEGMDHLVSRIKAELEQASWTPSGAHIKMAMSARSRPRPFAAWRTDPRTMCFLLAKSS